MTTKQIINKAIKEWIKQGRNKEQIYGVKNFMSGRGAEMAKEIYQLGLIFAWNTITNNNGCFIGIAGENIKFNGRPIPCFIDNGKIYKSKHKNK